MVVIFFLLALFIFFPLEYEMEFRGTVEEITENGFHMNPYLSHTASGWEKSELQSVFVQTYEIWPEGAEVEVSGVLKTSIAGQLLKRFVLIPKSVELIS